MSISEIGPPRASALYSTSSAKTQTRMNHLTKDLELTPNQREQIRPLLKEHHDRIQALFDNNPKLSRKDLGPQIRAISNETHHEIEALLTEHQKQLAKAMQEHMHDGEESRRPAPSR